MRCQEVAVDAEVNVPSDEDFAAALPSSNQKCVWRSKLRSEKEEYEVCRGKLSCSGIRSCTVRRTGIHVVSGHGSALAKGWDRLGEALLSHCV